MRSVIQGNSEKNTLRTRQDRHDGAVHSTKVVDYGISQLEQQDHIELLAHSVVVFCIANEAVSARREQPMPLTFKDDGYLAGHDGLFGQRVELRRISGGNLDLDMQISTLSRPE